MIDIGKKVTKRMKTVHDEQEPWYLHKHRQA